MTHRYLLRCDCGRDLEISECQAGQELACCCGKTLLIPTLRRMRALPQVAPTPAASGVSNSWTVQRGVMFSLGALLLLTCLPTLAYVGWQRSRIDLSPPDLNKIEYDHDIDALSPVDTLELWDFISTQSLFRNNLPTHILNRERAERLGWLMAAAGTLAVGGLISVLASLRPLRS